ncbi:MAG: flagellar hook-associated protein FlgK [Proteobacteria bacterium]|nr:flagellar hook-associated protein FlgK [Pseudomonadota bacterium]MBU1716469.1 flagellar hook-associated protein FlgK [Pseudomonadota bacterium]
MAGVTQVLSIAKEALLAHQLSVQVSAHNIANVDTPGYTRQTLELGANTPSPSGVGPLGGGVKGESILRHYDRFMTQRIASQQSLLSNLEAQKGALRVVETIFNEAQGFGVNDVMNQFWTSWQDLTNNPDVLATRQTVVQMGLLINDQLQYMSSEITQARYDIGVNLDAAIGDVNGLTSQIATLNVQITNTESENRTANDLRDQRDELCKELSGFLDINYFETRTGAYTVLLADGHALVETNESWNLDWGGNSLQWLSTNKDGVEVARDIGSGAELGGKVGGWLEVRGELLENDPDNYLGRLNAFANSLIREINQQHAQGVGLVSFDGEVTGKSIAANTAHLSTVVDSGYALETIPAGTLVINDRQVGRIDGGLAVNGLVMGKAENAVTQINKAITGVTAKLTTLVAGNAVTAIPLPVGTNDGDLISFEVEGVNVTYQIDNDGVGTDDTNAADFALNVVTAINAAISTYNGLPTTANPITVQAVVGDNTNGGVLNSIVLQNTNAGDESSIAITNLSSNPASGIEANLGLTAGIYVADDTHNTGEISLFSDAPFSVDGGNDDFYLAQLGMGGGLHPGDLPNDGEFTYSFNEPGGIAYALQGYDFADQLVTDGGTFDLWLYNSDGTLALAQPVEVSMERAYDLQDVVNAINISVTNASGGAPWITASIAQNQLRITPDANHTFAFADDNSNILQVAGINTFFTGYDSSDIGINQDLVKNLDLIAAGTVTEFGEIFRGDNTNGLSITALQGKEDVNFTGGKISTMDNFYNALVSEIGTDSRTVNRDFEYNSLVSNQMQEMRDSTSGVSLDEEMANLIKFQHAYTAAAKLITTADEMLVTLLESVKR